LTELEHKLSPDYVKEYAVRRAGEIVAVASDVARKYPATIACAATLLLGGVAAGVGYRQRRAADWKTLVRQILDEGRRYDGSVAHASILAKHAGQQAGQAVRSLAHDAAAHGHDAFDRGTQYAMHQASRLGESLVVARDQQPLITGLVLGVVLAAIGRRVL
jgi:hypothetical protein